MADLLPDWLHNHAGATECLAGSLLRAEKLPASTIYWQHKRGVYWMKDSGPPLNTSPTKGGNMSDIRPKFVNSSTTEGHSVVFVTKEEHDAYEAEALALIAKHKAIIRAKYGIYAPNQNKFVQNESDLNTWDGREFV